MLLVVIELVTYDGSWMAVTFGRNRSDGVLFKRFSNNGPHPSKRLRTIYRSTPSIALMRASSGVAEVLAALVPLSLRLSSFFGSLGLILEWGLSCTALLHGLRSLGNLACSPCWPHSCETSSLWIMKVSGLVFATWEIFSSWLQVGEITALLEAFPLREGRCFESIAFIRCSLGGSDFFWRVGVWNGIWDLC